VHLLAAAAVGDRDLDAGEDLDADLSTSRDRRGHARRRVVVGQGERVDLLPAGLVDELVGAERAVGGGGVHVKVAAEAHSTSPQSST
jgi:hypothetical protein